MKCSLGISNFLEEIFCLSFYCFPLFLCTDHWGRLSYLFLLFFGILHSVGYIFPFLLCLLLLLFSQLFLSYPQTTTSKERILLFLSFFFFFFFFFFVRWSWSLPSVQYDEPLFIVLQVLCLSDLIPWIYLSLLLYNHKGVDLGHTWMVYCFPLLSSIKVWIWWWRVNDLSYSQLQVLFFLTV